MAGFLRFGKYVDQRWRWRYGLSVMLLTTAESSRRASDAPHLAAPASVLAKRGIVWGEEANPFAQPTRLW